MPHFDLVGLIRTAGYLGVFGMIFAETGLLIGFFLPGDSLLFTAGFLASQHVLDVRVLVPGCLLAAIIGNATGYTLGRRVGRRLFNRPDSLFFRREHADRAEAFFARHGGKAVVLAQFLPVVRTFTPVVAGIGAMRYLYFAVFNLVGALVWAVGVTLGGYFLGGLIPASKVDTYLPLIIVAIIVLSVAPTAVHLWRESGDQIAATVRRQLRGSDERR